MPILFLAFLNQLVRCYEGTGIHLITGNVLYYKTPNICEWLEDNAYLIDLHFLQPVR